MSAEYQQYQPKGSMCMVCQKGLENCSKLPFEQMPMLYSVGVIAVVRCTQFVPGVKS